MAAVTLPAGATVADTSNVTSYRCPTGAGTFTPTAGALLVAFVYASGTVAPGATFTMTDSQSLGWTLITSALGNTSVSTAICFVANNLAAATAMSVTFDCTGDAATGANVIVAQVTGMTRTGASAVRQSATTANRATGGTPADTFPAAALTGNPTLGAVANSTSPAGLTPPTNWTELADIGYSTPATGLEVVSRDSGFTGTTITWGSTTSAGADIIVELDTSSLAVSLATPPRRPGRVHLANR